MKLSQLVNYQNTLERMAARPVADEADVKISAITHLVETQQIQIGQFARKLQHKRVNIQQMFDAFDSDLDELKSQLRQMIAANEKPWFQESYRMYEHEMAGVPADFVLDRTPVLTEDTRNFYTARVRKYNSWHYPAMIIRPAREFFINELLACDPLYLVDESHELLAPAMSKFNQQYQQRLRPYTIKEQQDQEILVKLPNEQFGYILAYNYFNYKPFEVIKKYFAEIYQKLRPGGILAMTFNDCDRDKAVILVENGFCCYTPGYLVKDLAQSVGFEINFVWDDQGPSTWLELKKPGEVVSLRGGQALAKIQPKPVAKSK